MQRNKRMSIVVAGVVLGGLLGGILAWLSSTRTAEGDETALQSIGPAELFQLGIGVLTLARQFQSMLQSKSK